MLELMNIQIHSKMTNTQTNIFRHRSAVQRERKGQRKYNICERNCSLFCLLGHNINYAGYPTHYLKQVIIIITTSILRLLLLLTTKTTTIIIIIICCD